MEEQLSDYARTRGFHPQTTRRWQSWEPAARAALGRLAIPLKISENHLRDLMDWLEEVAEREQLPIDTILADKAILEVETHARLGRADKLKRIKEILRKRRFPRLARIEEAIAERITDLKLRPEILVSTPPGLEGGSLRVEFTVSSQEALRQLAAKLVAAAEKDVTRQIFSLLSGETGVDPQCTPKPAR